MTSIPLAEPPSTPAPATRSREFWAGFRDTIPLVVGAVPFGIIFGALAVTNGLSPLAAIGMSLFVFAGSSQFIGSNLYGAGAALPLIVLTTFVVNVRHALYSATLAPYVRNLPHVWLVPLGFWLTDETFVIVARHYQEPGDVRYKHWYYFGSAIFMYVNWNVCTLIGIIAGQSIPDPARLGLDFALIVTFIGMVIPSITTRPILASVIAASIAALIFNPLPNNLGLMVAAIIGVIVGVVVENRLPAAETDTQKGVSA
ncbi:MAG: AzlC family ABC transporter permease [bacterium]|nr:AzlC family ABC transporter permease [bacterium]